MCTLEVHVCPDSHPNGLVQASLNLISDYYSDSDSDSDNGVYASVFTFWIPLLTCASSTVALFSIKCQAYFTVL